MAFILNIYRKLWVQYFRIKAKLFDKKLVHFFHIGKTGGTALKAAIETRRDTYENNDFIILFHGHKFKLKNTRKGEKFFFFVRDPIARFVSGFYSRKRKGAPKFHYEWTENEKLAFSRFDTPEDLANKLTSLDEKERSEAKHGMLNIGHVNSSYWDWFDNEKYFLSRINDLLMIGNQESLAKDFDKLKSILGLPEELKLPSNEEEIHKTPDHFDKYLSDLSIKNLKEWYLKEYDFLMIIQDYAL